MDNPAFFTVLHNDGIQPRVNGLLSSRADALSAAQSRRANGETGPFSICIVTLLDQDPVSGTPLGHLTPRDPVGFALGSLTAADPGRRGLNGILFTKEWIVRDLADSARAKRPSGNDTVFDVVAITVLTPED